MRIPFDYLDKVCLAATSREHGISSAPVWQLHVEGDFDEDVARRAVTALAARYPVIVSRASSDEPGKGLDKAKRIAYAVDAEPDIDALFRTVDLSGGDDAAFRAVQQEAFDHYIDMEHEYPVRLLWVRRGSGSGVLMLQQHHGIADGRAFFELISELCGFYDQVLEGSLPRDITPVGKIPEMLVAEPSVWRRLRYRLAGFLMHGWNILRYRMRPADQLVCNQPGDYSGHNAVTHMLLDEAEVKRVAGLKKLTGYSTNDVLSSALAMSLAGWSEEQGFPVRRFNVLCPADVRPRPWTASSFANHLSSFLLDFDLERCSAPLDILETVHRQVRRQAARLAPAKKILAEITTAKRLALGTVRNAVFATDRAMLNFPFSNLVPISPRENGGRYVTQRWSGEELRIMTPCAWLQGVNLTCIRYAGKICFNFNHKRSAIESPVVDQLIGRYQRTLTGLVDEAERGAAR